MRTFLTETRSNIYTYICVCALYISTKLVQCRSIVPTRTNSNVIGVTGNLGDVFY